MTTTSEVAIIGGDVAHSLLRALSVADTERDTCMAALTPQRREQLDEAIEQVTAIANDESQSDEVRAIATERRGFLRSIRRTLLEARRADHTLAPSTDIDFSTWRLSNVEHADRTRVESVTIGPDDPNALRLSTHQDTIIAKPWEFMAMCAMTLLAWLAAIDVLATNPPGIVIVFVLVLFFAQLVLSHKAIRARGILAKPGDSVRLERKHLQTLRRLSVDGYVGPYKVKPVRSALDDIVVCLKADDGRRAAVSAWIHTAVPLLDACAGFGDRSELDDADRAVIDRLNDELTDALRDRDDEFEGIAERAREIQAVREREASRAMLRAQFVRDRVGEADEL